MKILLLGYGKMGKAIEQKSLQEGYDIVAKIDSSADWEMFLQNRKAVDVAIEFTTPKSAPENIRNCFRENLPVVCGTTGWESEKESIIRECHDQNKTLFTAPNFSLGVNILFMLNRYLAAIMAKTQHYDVMIEEIHHIHKMDAPSGTAKALAQDIINLIQWKNQWTNSESNKKTDLTIISKREDEIPGTHIIRYESAIDDIELKHTAKNRLGFAHGALLAAKWIKNKTGYFTMDDLMNDLFGHFK